MSVSKILQGENVDLDQTVNLYEMLESCLMSLRNEEKFSTFKSKAKSMCGSQHYKKDTQRKRKLKLTYGESEKEHTEFNGRKSFITDSYYSAIDTLKSHLARRKDVYLQLRNSFGFLWNMNEVEKFDLKEKANNLFIS
ncbi:zinc finger MYM-type protein 1-like [Aphis craccivora]|uniref:Zinc finger MYM-type protein 1-like n=1 Tax=Aphis craccivora TaxID=307492 RepID=A0A6G0W318_APHCR|nr:zinc finger MYM-type protein 1-like [Aphis craccivora]